MVNFFAANDCRVATPDFCTFHCGCWLRAEIMYLDFVCITPPSVPPSGKQTNKQRKKKKIKKRKHRNAL